MAEMLGVWYEIHNPDRPLNEDLNITVHGTVLLKQKDVDKVPPGGLFGIKIQVWDSDTFSDDIVHTDQSFALGVHDTEPHPFFVGVLVPANKLSDSEPSWETDAEIYCRVSAALGQVRTNARDSETRDVKVH